MKVIIIEDINRDDLIALLNAGKQAPAAEPVVEAAPVPVVEAPAKVEPVEQPAKAETPAPVEEEQPAEEPVKAETKKAEKRRGRPKKEDKPAPAKAEPEPVKEETAPAKEAEKSEEPAETPTDELAEEETPEPTPEVSRTDVINLGKKLVKTGHAKAVTDLMKNQYNATKFSDISDDQLPAVFKAFKDIENAA